MTKFGTSQSVPRKEDVRFLTGAGPLLDDVAPEGAAHAVFVRSPVAHAAIAGLDVAEARAMPGVVAVYVAADLAGKLENAVDFETVRNRDGSCGAEPRRPILADDRVRYVGEAIAMVVAETPRGGARRGRGGGRRYRRPAGARGDRRGRAGRSTPRRPATSPTTGRSATRPRWRAPSTAAAHTHPARADRQPGDGDADGAARRAPPTGTAPGCTSASPARGSGG